MRIAGRVCMCVSVCEGEREGGREREREREEQSAGWVCEKNGGGVKLWLFTEESLPN